jgi:hypothetical protein
MVDEVKRAERAAEERVKEKPRDDMKPRPKESDFDQMLKKSSFMVQSRPQQMSSKTATEYAIKEAMKQEERQGEERKGDDKDKDKGKSSKNESRNAETRVQDHRVVAKGRLKQGFGEGGGGGGGGGGYGMPGGRRGMSKVLQRSAEKSIPVDLKGRFAAKVADAAKTATASHAQLTQQVINKLIQYVKIGINAKGQKEIQMELNERIFRGLKLRVVAKGGKVGVEFISKDPKGRKVLEQNSDALKKALADKGIEVDEIVFT